MLTKEEAQAKADALMAPKIAEQAASRHTPPQPTAFHKHLSQAIGYWGGIFLIGGLTIGLLVATWFRVEPWAGAGLGAGCGAILGFFFDRRLDIHGFLMLIAAVLAVAISSWVLGNAL